MNKNILAGLVIAPTSSAGYVGFFGFTALAVLWLITESSCVNVHRWSGIEDSSSAIQLLLCLYMFCTVSMLASMLKQKALSVKRMVGF